MNSKDEETFLQKIILPAIVGALLGAGGVGTALATDFLGIGNKPPDATIEVEDPPKVDTDNMISARSGMELEFSALKSLDPEDGNSLKYLWELKDESEEIVGKISKGLEYTTPPLEVGRYSLLLTVTDRRRKRGYDSYNIEILESELSDNSSSIEANSLSQEQWWQQWDDSKDMPPEGSLIVSFEEEDSQKLDPLFLCRALDEGILKPGKVVGSGQCYVPRYAALGNTINRDRNTRPSVGVSNYEIFVPKGAWEWTPLTSETKVDSIVSTDDNHSSAVCRISYGQKNSEGKMRMAKHPGILDQTINHCVFPWGNVSGFLDTDGYPTTYEVLVIK